MRAIFFERTMHIMHIWMYAWIIDVSRCSPECRARIEEERRLGGGLTASPNLVPQGLVDGAALNLYCSFADDKLQPSGLVYAMPCDSGGVAREWGPGQRAGLASLGHGHGLPWPWALGLSHSANNTVGSLAVRIFAAFFQPIHIIVNSSLLIHGLFVSLIKFLSSCV